MEIREIPHEGPRVETGPVRFGNDWGGLFIRGDNAFAIKIQIEVLQQAMEDLDENKIDLQQFQNRAFLPMIELANLKKKH